MKVKGMNKRGEEEELLMKETINIIVALLCIAALVALIFVVYFAVTKNQNSKYADAVVVGENGIDKEIKRINAGGEENRSYFIPNPSGWYVFSFTEELKPNRCVGANCVCVCEGIMLNVLNWQKRQAEKCDDKGSCAVVENLKSFEKIKIEKGGIFVSIRKVNGFIEIVKNA